MTEQRRVIARVLSDAADHPDVEQVYRRADRDRPAHLASRPSIAPCGCSRRPTSSSATISATAARATRRRPRTHHDHLIDLQTGEVIEFRNEEIESCSARSPRSSAIELVGHRLELYARAAEARRERRQGRIS